MVAVVALAAVDGDPFPEFGAGADRHDGGVGECGAARTVDDDAVAVGFELADGLLRVVVCGGGGDGGGRQCEGGCGESGGGAVAMVMFFMSGPLGAGEV